MNFTKSGLLLLVCLGQASSFSIGFVSAPWFRCSTKFISSDLGRFDVQGFQTSKSPVTTQMSTTNNAWPTFGGTSQPPRPSRTSTDISESPILQFYGPLQRSSLDKFEKFDDQIMGGISQSAMLPFGEGEDESAIFAGVVRVEGGGFCGSRMKLLTKPLNLSSYTGLYLKVKGDGKTYKLNCRTTPTSGEAVYQAEFDPPSSSSFSTIRIPFSAFREDKFNPKFQAGPFRLQVQEVGAYKDALQHCAWVDDNVASKGQSIEISSDAVIPDSLTYKPTGEKRGWFGRFLLNRVRRALRKRVASRRTQLAKDLLAKRSQGMKLSEIRRTSWTPPPK